MESRVKELAPGSSVDLNTAGGTKMKIRGIKVEQGIKIKTVGLTEKEKKILMDAIRRIKYGRKQDNRPSLPYLLELK